MSARSEFLWARTQPAVWDQMCDKLDQLEAQVAAVNAALDQYDAAPVGGLLPFDFVAAVAKAVGR